MSSGGAGAIVSAMAGPVRPVSALRVRARRMAAVSREPITMIQAMAVRYWGRAAATTAARHLSVLPKGPPLSRAAPAPAAAREMKVGSVAAVSAIRVRATVEGGAPMRRAKPTRPAMMNRSETRSPISLRTKPKGRETPRARATAPSRLAPPSLAASRIRAGTHQPMTRAPQPRAADRTPTAVHASGEMPRRTEPWMRKPRRRVYQYFSE